MFAIVMSVVLAVACLAAAGFFYSARSSARAEHAKLRAKLDSLPAHDSAHARRNYEDKLFELESRATSIGRAAVVAAVLAIILPLAVFLVAALTIVRPAHIGVPVTFGKVSADVLPEGLHVVSPVTNVVEIFTGLDTAEAKNTEAASRDLQSVRATLTAQFSVEPSRARDLYLMNPQLTYKTSYVEPALYEVFKSVTAGYTAEELVTKRAAVSAAIVDALRAKVAQFGLLVQNVNIVNFTFSKAFDEAIEAKVTATQQAEAAKNILEKTKYEAQQRIEQARGEAEAIRIQAEAIAKQGGQAYVDLKAIEKWDGKLPQYTLGGAVPFVSLNK